VGVTADLVRENEAGLIVAPEDVDAHARALEYLLKEEITRGRFAQASVTAGKRYSFEEDAPALLGLYARIHEER
jgi:glycosyltransferase involved in cell wall biosynthesis